MQTEAPGRLIRRAIWTAVAVWLLAWELRVLLAPELELGPLFSRFAHDGVLAAASALCLWAGIASPKGRERRAWIVIGAGVAAWTFGEIYYTAVLWTAEEIPIPSPADGGYLFFPPLVLVGVLMLVRSRTRDVPGTLWADGVTAALAVSAASAALVFDTVQEAASGQAIEIAVNLAYPIADLLLLGPDRRRARRHRLAARPHVGAAGERRRHLLARRLALPRPHRERHLRVGQLVRDRLVAGPRAHRGRRLAAGAAHAGRWRSTSGCGGSSSRSSSAPAASVCSCTAASPGSTSSPWRSPPRRCSR